MEQLTTEQDVAVVVLESSYDSLDEDRIARLRDVLLEQSDRVDPPHLIVDMSATTYIGSSFIEVLFRAWKRLRERDGQLVLCGVDENCEQVFAATRVDTLIESFPDRAQARAAVERG